MKKNDEYTFFGCVGMLVVIPVLIAYMIFSMSYAMFYLWQWFVVPMGVEQISMAHTYGLAILVNLLTTRGEMKQDDRPTDYGKLIGHCLHPWIALLFGYIIHTYFM